MLSQKCYQQLLFYHLWRFYSHALVAFPVYIFGQFCSRFCASQLLSALIEHSVSLNKFVNLFHFSQYWVYPFTQTEKAPICMFQTINQRNRHTTCYSADNFQFCPRLDIVCAGFIAVVKAVNSLVVVFCCECTRAGQPWSCQEWTCMRSSARALFSYTFSDLTVAVGSCGTTLQVSQLPINAQ